MKILLTMLLLALTACASKEANRSVDDKLAETPNFHNGDSSQAMIKDIQNSQEISPTQKSQLLSLHEKLESEAAQYRTQLLKLKVVLLETMLNPKASDKEIQTIRNRLVSLDRERMNKMLAGMEQVQHILGRRTFEDNRVYRAFVTDQNKPGVF